MVNFILIGLIIYQTCFFIYKLNLKFKKYRKYHMGDTYISSFVDADIIADKLIFTRGDGTTYTLNINEFQDRTGFNSVNLEDNVLTFVQQNGSTFSINLSKYNGFDNAVLDNNTKDLIFYVDGNEVLKVNFETIINNSFISGNPFISATVIDDNLIFTKVNGQTQSLNIHSLQDRSSIISVTLQNDILTFRQQNGNTTSINLSPYHGIKDVTYNNSSKILSFYKDSTNYLDVNLKDAIELTITDGGYIIKENAFIDVNIENDKLMFTKYDNITKKSINIIDLQNNDVLNDVYFSDNVLTFKKVDGNRIDIPINMSEAINSETSQRISSDNSLSTLLSSETIQRISNDNSISINLAQRVSIDSSLSVGLSQRVSVDTSLSVGLNLRASTDLSLSTEIIQKTSVDKSLSTSISQNTSTQISLSSSINNKANTVHTHGFNSILSNIVVSAEVLSYVLSTEIIELSGSTSGTTTGLTYVLSTVISGVQSTVDLNYILSASLDEYFYKKSILKDDIVWDNGRVKIVTVGNKYVKDIRAKMVFGYGIGEYLIDCNITYQNGINCFYLNDINNRLRKDVQFISLELEYNTTSTNYNNTYTNYAKKLGKNIINVHQSGDWTHAIVTEACITGIEKKYNGKFGNIYTSFLYSDLNTIWNNSTNPTLSSKYDSASLYQSYTYASESQNQYDLPEFLEFGSQAGNSYYDYTYKRAISWRYDITNSPTKFINSIACTARVDDTTSVLGQTSYGNGTEFFEDCSYDVIKEEYGGIPECDNVLVMAFIDGTRVYCGDYQRNFTSKLEVGGIIYIRPTNNYTSVKEYRKIIEIVSSDELIIDRPFDSIVSSTSSYVVIWAATLKLEDIIGAVPAMKIGDCQVSSDGLSVVITNGNSTGIEVGNRKLRIRITPDSNTWQYFDVGSIVGNTLYVNQVVASIEHYSPLTPNITGELWINSINYFHMFKDDPLHPYEPAGQAQSWATPIICAKFNVIRNKTGFSWKQIRDAARYTAKKSGKTEDGYDWDMHRGFGKIDVNATIERLNYLYASNTDKLNEARNLETLNGLSPVLEYNDLYDNSPVSKKMVQNILDNGLIEFEDNDAAINGGLKIGDFYRTGDILKIVH